jgi:hypothetical protein
MDNEIEGTDYHNAFIQFGSKDITAAQLRLLT